METQIKSEPGKIKKAVPTQKITPFLWFDNQTEEAVNFYLTVIGINLIIEMLHQNGHHAEVLI